MAVAAAEEVEDPGWRFLSTLVAKRAAEVATWEDRAPEASACRTNETKPQDLAGPFVEASGSVVVVVVDYYLNSSTLERKPRYDASPGRG